MPVICCSRNLLPLSRWRNNRSWSKRFVKRKVEHWRMIPFTSRCLSTFPKFTNEVQHLVGENFSRGIIPQALARGIVVGLDQLAKALLGQGGQVGLAGQEAAHSADGVLHPPFLPGGADIAEEGLDTQGMELVMPGELGAVVEGDTPAPLGWEGGQDGSHSLGDRVGGLAWGAPGDEQTGVAFVEVEELRINSRATVDGARSRLATIWRCECPAVRSREISHRSSMVSC